MGTCLNAQEASKNADAAIPLGNMREVASALHPETSESAYEDTFLDAKVLAETEKNNTISLDLRGIEITELLKVLSQKLKKNILPSKNVTGRINLFLNDVSYEEVLDIIMICQDLAYEEKGNNVVIVMTASEYEALYGKKFNEKRKLLTLKLKYAPPQMIFNALSNVKSTVGNIVVDESTGTIILIDTPEKLKDMKEIFNTLDRPNVTEAFELQYAKVADIEGDITSIATTGASTIVSDERTNTIMVTDLPGNMNKIRQTLRMLDQETRQVLIEAEVMQITLSDEFNYGVEWQKILNNPSLWSSVLTGGFAGTGMTSAYQRISMGVLEENKFNVAINVLKGMGDVKILSSPKIAVINNEEATIHVGTRQAIVTGTLSQSGDSTITSDNVEFIDVGLKLVVVPTINRDGFVTMKIKPEVSSVTDTVTTGSEDEPRSVIPIITTSEAQTTVKVKDGSMIMITGLREYDKRCSVDGVPFLSDWPILGPLLFSNKDKSQTQTELVVFLMPHIIRGDEMMAWDLEKIKVFDEKAWPEKRGFFEPKLKASSLKRKMNNLGGKSAG
ncbi:MAG: secretin N-terminal domain-containing protein [Candidatus Omnitrophota bacterium]